MPNTPKTKLREEWNKWLFKEEGNTHTYKLPNSDEISDWWLARFQEELSLLEEKIKVLPNIVLKTKQGNKEVEIELEAVFRKEALTLFSQYKEELK